MEAFFSCREIIVSLILFINLCLQIHPISAQLHDCTNTIGNYTQNSKFQSNLNTILTSVSSNINTTNGFYNGTAGDGVDQVNAIAYCRGDIDIEMCRGCVNVAARNLTTVFCLNQKEAIVWRSLCMFRYSNNSILGIMSLDPSRALVNTQNASDVDLYSSELISFAGNLSNAAYNGSPRKFAGMKSSDPNAKTVYGFMECTPDITPGDCLACLNNSANEMSKCCYNHVGAQWLTPSCIYRFEIYSFLKELPPPPPPPPSPPPSSSTTSLLPPPTSKGMKPTIKNKKSDKSKTIIIVVCVTVALLVLTLSVCVFITRRRRQNAKTGHKQKEEELKKLNEIRDTQTRQYDFSSVRAATEDFSTANKLGRGGFGEVYKGVLSDGKEIAVKRLSTTSGQGENEFMNEVKSLAKLQHKCLVKLLGFCLEQTERLVIYEFMANGSLDKVLFDPVSRSRLDWERRYKIIKSVARGILYLHEDSRMMIIHRDLKASNILLDEGMNAKISDFGMARLFVLDEGEVLTKRIAGTFGYMAPEYAMHGLFSVKSDVYSYGVLLLEIICGKKTYSALTEERMEYLPAYAYKTWKEDKALDLIDPMLTVDSDSMQNLMKCIHIALLCVQENAGDRPTMATMIHMLQSSTLTLPTPSGPGFFIRNTETIAPIAISRCDILLNDGETDSYQYPR